MDRSEFLDGRPAEQASTIAAVLERLATARLVTMDRNTVEVTHEALLGAWPRLRDWLGDDRDGLRIHRQLIDAARSWAELDRDPSALYQGTRLDAATGWAADPRWAADLAPLEREFLDASVARQTSEQRALRRRNSRLLQLTGGLAALLVVAVAASGMALQQRDQARQQRNQARQQHQLAVSHTLVAQSIAEYPRDPATGLLLGVAAARIASTTEARSNLLSLTGSGELTATLPLTGPNGVQSLAISPDGRILASADSGTAARLWDVHRHAPLATLPGHWGFVNSVAFSPDGRTLVTTSDGRAANGVKLWDVRRRTLLATLPGGEGHGVAFSPDGRILAVPTLKQGVQLWDVRRRTLLTTLPSVGAVAFSPDGHTLTVATIRQGVQLWDLRRRALLASLDTDAKAFSLDEVVFSPNGHTLAVTTVKQGVQLWDVRQRKLLRRIPSRDHDASAVAFSPDGHTVATATSANEVQLWSDDDRVRVLTGSVGRVLAMGFTSDGRTLITGGGEIGFWDLDPVLFLADPDTRETIAFSPDGRTLLVSDDLAASRLWDLRQRAWLPTRLGANAVLSVDGRTIAAITGLGTVQLWDGQRRTLRASLRVPIRPSEPPIDALALSPDGETLALLTDDYRVQVWDTSRRARLTTLVDPKPRKQELPLPWIAFSPDGRTLAIPAADESGVRLWDVRRRALLATLPGPGYAPAFSPDGRTIATASGNTVRLWSLERRVPVATLSGHTGTVLDLAFSPDGHMLASIGGDNTVRLWEVDQRVLLATLAGHDKAVYEVAFSPDGHTLVTASADGVVRLWAASTSHAVTRICARVGHDLSQQQWARFVPDSPHQHACTQP